MTFSQTPVRHAAVNDANTPAPGVWPATRAPVRQILREGLELGRATVFVGKNGSGTSTLVEAVSKPAA